MRTTVKTILKFTLAAVLGALFVLSLGTATGSHTPLPLAVSLGGTGAAISTANYVFAGPTSGGAAAPGFRALVASDIPAGAGGTTISAARSTLSGTLTLTSSSAQLQFADPNGTTRGVTLPSSPTSGLFYDINNFASVNGGKYLVVRDASGVLVEVIGPGETFRITYDGTAWQSSRKKSYMLGWWRADAGVYQNTPGTTAASADADPVREWQDQSGLGNHAVAGADGNRPLLKLNIQNSKPVLRFNSANPDTFVITPRNNIPDGMTLIVVAARAWSDGGGGNHRCIWGTSGGSNSNQGFTLFQTNSTFGDLIAKDLLFEANGYENFHGPRSISNAGALTDNTFHVISHRSGRESDAHIDGVLSTKPSWSGANSYGSGSQGGYPTAVKFRIATADTGNEWPWNGDIAEIVAFYGAIPDSECAYYDILEGDKYNVSVTR
jgi:hypothetical protein